MSTTTYINRSNKEESRAFESEHLFGAKYQERVSKTMGFGFLTCVFCGRDTSKQGKSMGAYVGAGGGLIIHPSDYDKAHDGGEMGWFPIGSECIKSVPTEFRVPNPYEDKVNGV